MEDAASLQLYNDCTEMSSAAIVVVYQVRLIYTKRLSEVYTLHMFGRYRKSVGQNSHFLWMVILVDEQYLKRYRDGVFSVKLPIVPLYNNYIIPKHSKKSTCNVL